MMEQKKLWDVRFVSWDAFSRAVVDQEGSVWELMTHSHLLIGGVNFTNNFL